MDSQVIRYELLRRYFLDVFLTLLGIFVLRNLFERLFPNIYHHIAIIHEQSQTKLFWKLGNFLRKAYMLKLGLCKAIVHWKVKWTSNVPLILSWKFQWLSKQWYWRTVILIIYKHKFILVYFSLFMSVIFSF